MRWFLAAALILLAALLFESGLLAYAMYVLLGLLVLSRVLARSWTANLRASRRCDRARAEVGESVAVEVTVRNAGLLPVPWVLLEDMLPGGTRFADRFRVRVKKKRLKLAMLWPRGETTLRYRVQFKVRGYHQVGPLVLESG